MPLGPAGAASATAIDMARFMVAHLGLGAPGEARILRAATAARMQRTLHRHERGVSGMARGFIESDRNGHRVVGHGGDPLWFYTQLELYPDHGIGLFASFDTAGAEPRKLAEAFADRYFPAAEWSALLPAPDWSERARRLTGAYRSTPRLREVLLLPMAGAALAVVSLLSAVSIWRGCHGTVAARLGYTLVVAAFLVVLWQLRLWRLLGSQG